MTFTQLLIGTVIYTIIGIIIFVGPTYLYEGIKQIFKDIINKD